MSKDLGQDINESDTTEFELFDDLNNNSHANETTNEGLSEEEVGQEEDCSGTGDIEPNDNENHANSESEVDVSSCRNDIKDPLAQVNLEAPEIDAFNDIFGDDNEQQEEESEIQIQLELKLTTSPNGTKRITKITDEVEMTYELGSNPIPMEAGFQVKLNDILSGNVPYKENVSFCYFFNSTELN